MHVLTASALPALTLMLLSPSPARARELLFFLRFTICCWVLVGSNSARMRAQL
jgi:hypothetical protein